MPLSGALGAEQLARLYGLAVNEPNLEVLMRHRAVMFGLLGLFMIAAAFMPSLQVAALIAGFASVISFLWLAFSIGGYNTQLAKVVIADLVALVCLLVGGVALAISPPAR
ncbi:MAG: phosphopantetheine adenylyltransferase [Burkholderiales bacterium]|nr:phosphopantetheine adenylyltransferase [Burkholderiales bacterium]